jgi:hypothetical protein
MCDTTIILGVDVVARDISLFLKIVTIVKIILKKKKDNPLPFC